MEVKKGKGKFVIAYQGGGTSPTKKNMASRKVFDLQEQCQCEKLSIKSILKGKTNA